MSDAAVGDWDTGVTWGKVWREGLCGSLGMAERKKRPQKAFCYRDGVRLQKLGLEEQKERWRSEDSLSESLAEVAFGLAGSTLQNWDLE